MTLQPIATRAPDFVPGQITDEEGGAMLRAVVNLFGKLQITDEDAAVLLDLSLRTYCRWKAGQPGRLDRDMKARLSNLLGIHKALRLIFTDPNRTYAWINAKTPHLMTDRRLMSCLVAS